MAGMTEALGQMKRAHDDAVRMYSGSVLYAEKYTKQVMKMFRGCDVNLDSHNNPPIRRRKTRETGAECTNSVGNSAKVFTLVRQKEKGTKYQGKKKYAQQTLQ